MYIDKLTAHLTIEKNGLSFIGQSRVDLLLAIRDTGSISQAAKNVGISYKAAWDSIDAINNLADRPLVERVVGGKNGGGTRLTDYGTKFLHLFLKIESEYRQRFALLSKEIEGFSDIQNMARRLALSTSARNQLAGAVKRITKGAVNSEITVDVEGVFDLVAIVPNSALVDMRLKTKTAVYVLFSASSILISTDAAIKFSARNQLAGVICRIEQGAVNSEVSIDIGHGKTLCAIINNSSLKDMRLAVGERVSSLIKASDLIIAVRPKGDFL